MASDAQKISELLKVDEAQNNAASEHKETTPATRYTTPQPSPLLTKEIQPAGQDRQLTTIERLNKIAESKAESRDEVKKIQTEINTIIDTMAKNSSLLSRASNTWGELGFIEKTLTGSFIIVPLIPAVILGNVVTLLVLGGFAVSSAGSLYVLEDHYQCGNLQLDNLKISMKSLAQTLNACIVRLERLADDLEIEVSRLKVENDRLTNKVDELSDAVRIFSGQLEALIETRKILEGETSELHVSIENLKTQSQINQDEFKAKNATLTQVTEAYEKNEQNLKLMVASLEIKREEMAKEANKAKSTSDGLQKLLGQMVEAEEQKKKDQETFFIKIDSSASKSQQAVDKVVTNLTETNVKYAKAQKELCDINQSSRSVLEAQKEMLGKLEEIYENLGIGKIKTSGLKECGMFVQSMQTNGGGMGQSITPALAVGASS